MSDHKPKPLDIDADANNADWLHQHKPEEKRKQTFTLKGHRSGEPVEIVWTDGNLSGDPDAVKMVEMIAKGAEGRLVASPTDSTTHDHLSNPSSAYMLMCRVFEDVPVETDSDIEPLPPLPEGAVE